MTGLSYGSWKAPPGKEIHENILKAPNTRHVYKQPKNMMNVFI